MISPSIITWLHLGRGVTRVVLGHHLGPEIPGPVVDLARAHRVSSASELCPTANSGAP